MSLNINNVPYEMNEISNKLFNKQFLSDIRFNIEGKEIYAHSLELMKRSDVFQRQLEPTLGEKKLIAIANYGYDDFFEFIRFIYTDECEINADNRLNLLKIAIDYNVIRLINVIQNSIDIDSAELYEFCVEENHSSALYFTELTMALVLEGFLSSNLSLPDSDLLDGFLKYGQLSENVTEMKLVEFLISWIENNNKQNKTTDTFAEYRQKFDKLIRLIRFPILSNKELFAIKNKYPGLLTESDLTSISGQKTFGAKYENGIFNCTPRKMFEIPFEQKLFSSNNYFETKFSVACNMILGGFTFACAVGNNKRFNIKISNESSQLKGKSETSINVNQNGSIVACSFSLGSSFRITPNITYIIGYKLITENNSPSAENSYCSRLPEFDIRMNAPPNSVTIIQGHPTMYELFFLNADGKPF